MKVLEEFDTFLSVECIAMETFRNWAKAFGKFPSGTPSGALQNTEV